EPKRKKAKKDVFTVNLYYDGLFTSCPMIYFQGQCKVLTDTNFDEMTYVHLLEILKRLVPNGFEKVYYCKSGAKLTSIREIKSDQDIVDMLKVGYDNGFQIDMYVDHFGYDIMEMVKWDRNEELRNTRIKAELDSSDDDYHYSDDDLEEIENVDFHTEGDDSVVIKNITTQDPFLTKLCSARVLFRGHVEFGVNEETPQVDPDDNQIDLVYKVKKGVVYPAFDPDIPWDKMEPILGMRFETPHQLKMALANYGVAMLPTLVRTRLFRGDEGNQASKKSVKKPVKKLVKKPVKKIPDSKSGEVKRAKQLALFDHEGRPYRALCKTLSRRHLSLKEGRMFGSWVREAWAVVRVENADNWGWFLHLLHDDLCLNDGTGITIISDSHKSTEIVQDIYIESFKKKYRGIDPISPCEEIGCTLCKISAMNKLLHHLRRQQNTPSIRKRLEILKEKQREWVVYPSGFQELEVRKGDQSYGVSLQHKVCQCRLWELSGIPCVHAVAGYMHVGTDLDAGVSHWYSREAWFNAYQFSIKPVFGTNMWKRTNDVPPLPPIIRKMPGRPQKKRIPAPGETSGSQCASRGGSRSGRGDGNDGSGSGSGVNDASGSGVNAGSVSGGRGGGRAGGSGGRGGGRAVEKVKGVVEGLEEVVREVVYFQAQVVVEYQLELDEQAFRECMEEQAREQAKIDAEQEKLDKERREEQEYEEKNDYFNPANWPEESMEEAPMNQQYHEVFIPSIHSQPTQQSGVWVVDTTVSVADVDEAPEQETSDDGPAVDKGKAKASVEDGPAPEQGISIEDGPAPKKKRGRPPSSVDGIRIHHKNRGRSERIANMKLNKPFQFDKFGTGSTPDKAFDVEE
ncbi:F-box domain containing protein, partial [Tanacetum coccineum]